MSNQKDHPARMPEWLKTLLETKTGGFRNARWQRCQNCQEITLHGMDDDTCAGMVTTDPTPLTRQQEMWCAIQGRQTYSANIDGDRKVQLWHRTKYSLAKPARHPVIPEHICGQRYPGFIEALRKTTATAGDDTPPF